MKSNLLLLIAILINTTVFSNLSSSERFNKLKVKAQTSLSYTLDTEPTSCYGYSDGQASIFVTGGEAPYSYAWSNQSSTANAIALNAGNYSVTVTDANEDKIIINNILIEEPLPIVVEIFGEHMYNGESWICLGETETLNSSATGGLAPYTFYWNDDQVSNSISVSPTETTTYNAYAIDSKGCVGSTSEIIVNVHEAITFSATATPSNICEGEEVFISINANGGNGNYQYQIHTGTTNQNINSSVTISPETSNNYTIKVTDNCNSPSAEEILSITVNPLPVVDFRAVETAGCQPFETSFINNTSLDKNSYVWSFESSDLQSFISTQENPEFTFDKLGQYHVNLKATSEHGCSSEMTEYNYITIFQSPEAQFEADNTILSTINTTVFFDNYSHYHDQSLWIFDDQDSSRQSSPLYTFPHIAGEYQVELIATNRHGCTDRAYETIKVIDKITLNMPTAFSPNGDNINELFYVSGNGIKSIEYSFSIYDRWGTEIFHTDDINQAWNGQTSGQIAPEGIYTWHVRFVDEQQIKYEKTGQVTLIR